ncbi:hypothetical protein [Salinarimonas soli]|uniref:Methylase-associated X1 domain-containing protein n=1 Tax=Salinarimonas soli TaxID=1638099 RepID=A0A5B2V826_9HYPH|nr:hypothetical protein [Salinarimonas soli]KAA2234908.1 hypothetical protein F0L46_21415 [Salinarimonas soli]
MPSLEPQDRERMLHGFEANGYPCMQHSKASHNPYKLEWFVDGEVKKFNLWIFSIEHGGSGSSSRAPDEYRIQMSSYPKKMADYDQGGYKDILMGYDDSKDVVIIFDRRWLETETKKFEVSRTRSSNSAQCKIDAIDQAVKSAEGIYISEKQGVSFGKATIITARSEMFPKCLLMVDELMSGVITPADAAAASTGSKPRTVFDYCVERNLPFSPDLLARYIASFLSKPFVIIAGISGTGKSKIAELVGEYYSFRSSTSAPTSTAVVPIGPSFVFGNPTGTPDPTAVALIPVRPDWVDSKPMLGYVNPITNHYECTRALETILRADRKLQSTSDKSLADRYFMILDEMNLARVEQYFSDWLACTESRRLTPEGNIVQQPVSLHRLPTDPDATLAKPDGTAEVFKVPRTLELPTNLVLVGTVNVDETTQGFSPKVLDRSMVLEFDEVDLERLRNGGSNLDPTGFRFPLTLPSFALPSDADYKALPDNTHTHLKSINSILESSRLHFGYRSAVEMARFIKIYHDIIPEDTQDTDWLRALDVAVLQKVLPRLSGNRSKLINPLARLCGYLKDGSVPTDTPDLEDLPDDPSALFPRSYSRAREMLLTLEEFGYVSFFK